MIGLALLKRFWPYLAVAGVLIGAGWSLYAAGARSVQAKWDAAERAADDALLVANTKTALVTDRAEVISTDIGEAFDEDLTHVDRRADSLAGRTAGLSLCRTAPGSSEYVPAVPAPAGIADGQGTSEGGDSSAGGFGSTLAEALTACRKVIAADLRHIEFHERQHENRAAN